jgi:hypothetical protein
MKGILRLAQGFVCNCELISDEGVILNVWMTGGGHLRNDSLRFVRVFKDAREYSSAAFYLYVSLNASEIFIN